MGGSKGSVLFGGADAYDTSSMGGLKEMMLSIGGTYIILVLNLFNFV